MAQTLRFEYDRGARLGLRDDEAPGWPRRAGGATNSRAAAVTRKAPWELIFLRWTLPG